MGFRDDREALRARLAALEGALEEARSENAALRRRHEAPRGPLERFLGGPTLLRHELTLEGDVPESAHEELIEALRARFQTLGRVSRNGRTLTWSSGATSRRAVEASVAIRGRRTVIRLTEGLAPLARGLIVGVGGVGMGLLAIPIALSFRAPVLIPYIAIGWLLSVYAVIRGSYRTTTSRRDAELRASMEELGYVAEAAIDDTAVGDAAVDDAAVDDPAQRVRVGDEAGAREQPPEEEPEDAASASTRNRRR